MKTRNYTGITRLAVSMAMAWLFCCGPVPRAIGAHLLDLGLISGACGSHGTAGLGITDNARAAGYCLDSVAFRTAPNSAINNDAGSGDNLHNTLSGFFSSVWNSRANDIWQSGTSPIEIAGELNDGTWRPYWYYEANSGSPKYARLLYTAGAGAAYAVKPSPGTDTAVVGYVAANGYDQAAYWSVVTNNHSLYNYGQTYFPSENSYALDTDRNRTVGYRGTAPNAFIIDSSAYSLSVPSGATASAAYGIFTSSSTSFIAGYYVESGLQKPIRWSYTGSGQSTYVLLSLPTGKTQGIARHVSGSGANQDIVGSAWDDNGDEVACRWSSSGAVTVLNDVSGYSNWNLKRAYKVSSYGAGRKIVGYGTPLGGGPPHGFVFTPGGSVVSGGWFHSVAAKQDGTVWAWGDNYAGGLGDGTTTQRLTPVQASSISGVSAVAAGGWHTMALKSDGTVWTWGYNYYGQVGDGTINNRLTPYQVSGLSGIVAISAGTYSSYALKNDGTVWAWGNNFDGALGDGTSTQRNTPVPVSGLTGVISVSGGDSYCLALKSDGTVRAWGHNAYGQLGDGTTTSRLTPVQISSFSQVAAVSAGGKHSLALKSDGTVWAWGYNADGELGNGTTTDSHSPTQTSSLTGIAAIDAGWQHSIAAKNDGSVWGWGLNASGQLGDGTTTTRLSPVQTSSLTQTYIAIAGGWHSLAVKTDLSLRSWGSNGNGQLGDNSTTARSTPVSLYNNFGL